jgi:hypothetical protein
LRVFSSARASEFHHIGRHSLMPPDARRFKILILISRCPGDSVGRSSSASSTSSLASATGSNSKSFAILVLDDFLVSPICSVEFDGKLFERLRMILHLISLSVGALAPASQSVGREAPSEARGGIPPAALQEPGTPYSDSTETIHGFYRTYKLCP